MHINTRIAPLLLAGKKDPGSGTLYAGCLNTVQIKVEALSAIFPTKNRGINHVRQLVINNLFFMLIT